MAVVYYFIQEDCHDKATEIEARQRIIFSGPAFRLYSIIVRLSEYEGTWIRRFSIILGSHLEEFAWQLATIGDQTNNADGPLQEFVFAAKMLRLIVSVAIVSTVTFATTTVINAVQGVTT